MIDRYNFADAVPLADSWSELSTWLDWAVDKKRQTEVEHCEEYTKEQMAPFDAWSSLVFKIVVRKSQSFVGQIGPYNIGWDIGKFTIGYWIRTTFTGRGIATEACNALTRYAFGHLQDNGVGLGARDENVASMRVIEKLNPEQIGTWPDADVRRDGSPGARSCTSTYRRPRSRHWT